LQAVVGFGKVVMRADLYRAVSCVFHQQGTGSSAGVQRMLSGINEHFAWNHAAHLRVSHQIPTNTTASMSKPNKSEACECGETSP
jgi:hypothetical protein